VNHTATIFVFGTLGFATHVLGTWADYCKQYAKVGLWTYVQLDPPSWIASLVGTAVVLSVSQEVDPFLPIHAAPEVLSVLLGYTGSSVLAKLSGILGFGTGDR
jgi:hypothetical protein